MQFYGFSKSTQVVKSIWSRYHKLDTTRTAFRFIWERFLRFLGKLLELTNFFKCDGFLRVVQSEDNHCMVVP